MSKGRGARGSAYTTNAYWFPPQKPQHPLALVIVIAVGSPKGDKPPTAKALPFVLAEQDL